MRSNIIYTLIVAVCLIIFIATDKSFASRILLVASSILLIVNIIKSGVALYNER